MRSCHRAGTRTSTRFTPDRDKVSSPSIKNRASYCRVLWLEASAEAAKARFADEKVSSRCKLLAADLTQSVPAGADVYMLKHVLHGRRDAEAITILNNCRAVIPANGSLLVIEFILPPLISQADPHLAPDE